MFQHLITRAEIIEANLAARMGKRADAINKRYAGRKGNYLSLAFGTVYYAFSIIFLPVLTASLIFLYLFLRYLLPLIYVLFCISALASYTAYILSSNIEWAMRYYDSLALLVFRPFLSDYAILLIYIIVPTLVISAFLISLMTAIAILYRKAIFVDAAITTSTT